ncbi:MKRN2 opposite strand protein isoform X2 [Phalacrocorax carbo]|uniref:MKRN2 opposite strand protein isoform X2 n=1 Tax=Phalacrocorax carbo TaxID=9209 RepID=UPI003119FD75
MTEAATAAILRVRHCGADIFCRRVPPCCPACHQPLPTAGLRAAPLRIPSPFRHGHRQPRAFLLRPTAGTFLGGYDGKSDLHVGITNSNGKKYFKVALQTTVCLPYLVFTLYAQVRSASSAQDHLNAVVVISEPPRLLQQYLVPVKNAGCSIQISDALLLKNRNQELNCSLPKSIMCGVQLQ